MKTHTIFTVVVALAVSLVLDCQTKANSDGTVTVLPPPDPKVHIQNSYGAQVSVEIWTGTDLEYKEGKVYGNSLSRLTNLTDIANAATGSNLATITYGGTFLIVVGVNDAGTRIYVTSRKITGYLNTTTYTVTSSGAIN